MMKWQHLETDSSWGDDNKNFGKLSVIDQLFGAFFGEILSCSPSLKRCLEFKVHLTITSRAC